MSWLNVKIGGAWNQVKSAFERDDIGDVRAGFNEAPMEDAVKETASRYAPIKEAIERRISTFLKHDLVSHLEIGFNEQFVLNYIEISSDSQGRDALMQFLREFSPEARVEWVKRLLGPAVRKHVSVEQFLGVDREFSVDDLAESDPFEEELNQALTPTYRVILHGRWETRPVVEVVAPEASAQPIPHAAVPARATGPLLRLTVADAKPQFGLARRTIEIDTYPVTLGSSARTDVEISGYYVSALHCTLHEGHEGVSLEDHSTNGTWVDGKRAPRGVRVPLRQGAVIAFGRSDGDRAFERYPQFSLHYVQRTGESAGGHTPIVPAYSATPVVPEGGTPIISSETAYVAAHVAFMPATVPPLAVLAVVDASGNPRRDILKLPFSIGRGSAQDYVVPDANQGVSREHLVIEKIDQRGATVKNLGNSKNGSFADGQALPEEFSWQFGQEIVLAERWSSAPVVRLCLRRVEH